MTLSSARALLATERRPTTPTQDAVERLVARAYGFAYDAIVTGFAPYEALIDEIAAFVAGATPAAPGRPVRVLDVACGTGTLAHRLARPGYSVVGLDVVSHLVDIARAREAGNVADLEFHHADIAHDAVPGGGSFDVLVSMHTLYWHPEPDALLRACRRALRPGGHALFLTYTRPALVVATFRRLWVEGGPGRAIDGLRWLLPTAAFERFRHDRPRYFGQDEFHDRLRGAGFDILASRQTFLSGISLLAWTKTKEEE